MGRGVSALPRKEYKPANRFWARSKLSEYELALLFFYWGAGRTATEISDKFSKHPISQDRAFFKMTENMHTGSLRLPKPTPVRSVSRQTVTKYINTFSEAFFFHIFEFDSAKRAGSGLLISEIERWLEKRDLRQLIELGSKWGARRGVNDLKNEQGIRLVNNIFTAENNEIFDSPENMFEFSVRFFVWAILTETHSFKLHRSLGIKTADKEILEPVLKFGQNLYRRSNGIALSDMQPVCVLLNLHVSALHTYADVFVKTSLNFPRKKLTSKEALRVLTKAFLNDRETYRRAMGIETMVNSLRLLSERPISFT